MLPGDVEFKPSKSMASTLWISMMIVMPAFTKS